MQADATETDPVADNPQSIPLVVDLDGTLCCTDTLHEGLLALAAANPRIIFRLPKWLSEGRAAFKARLADQGVVDPAELPLNDAVVEMIKTARAEGRQVALVSAADHRQVTAVAEAIGLFDAAYGTAEGKNLKGAAKAAFLSELYGAGKFDYIGDSEADLAVWKAARKAITVRANPKLRQAASAANAQTHHIDPPVPRHRAMLRALRPHQWSKNLLMFLPAFAAHDLTRLWPVGFGFIAFCFAASAVYVINDLLDLAADRAHPRKRLRPFAAGELSAATGVTMASGLLFVSVIFGSLTGNPFFLMALALYLLTTFAYSFWLKRKLIVDVITLAGLYTVRIVSGAVAASLILSPWLLGFSMFLFLALAAVKRQAELTDQLASGRTGAGRAYEVDDLPIIRSIALSASQAAVLVLALYISSDVVQTLYATPSILWMICPILLYWSTRMVMKAHRGAMPDDPIVFAATDKVSLLLIAISAIIALLATL